MALNGKVAVVTGAQQGIGAAAALALAARGARVVVNWLDDEAAALGVLERIRAAGGDGAVVRADVAQAGEVQALMQAAAALGPIGVLVNNAGIFPRVDFLSMSEDDWDRVHGINLRGAFLCARAGCRLMVEQGCGGAVINLSSAAAHSGPALGVHYAATKAGLIGFTRALAVAMGEHGIRVNAVAPGLTDTAQPRDGMTEAEIAASGERLPLGRIAMPADIASTIAFLADDEARHVTGQVLHVNGGQLFP